MKLLTIIFSFLLSIQTFAGQENGGGMVSVVDGKYILYDFLEAGVEKDAPFIWAFPIKDMMEAKTKIRHNITSFGGDSPISEDDVDGVVHILNYVYARNPDAAKKMLEVFMQYSWLVTSQKVVDANDLGPTPIVLANGVTVIPAAYRDDTARVVWIYHSIWQKLNLQNRVGLLMHEVLYAIGKRSRGLNSSYYPRIVNAMIFNPIFIGMDAAKIDFQFANVFGSSLIKSDVSFYMLSPMYRKACGELKDRTDKLFDNYSANIQLIMNRKKTLEKVDHYCTSADLDPNWKLYEIKQTSKVFQLPATEKIPRKYKYLPRPYSVIEFKRICSSEKKTYFTLASDLEQSLLANFKEARAVLDITQQPRLSLCLEEPVVAAIKRISETEIED